MNRLKIFAILCGGIFLAGCASEVGGEETEHREHFVEDVSLFISAEDSPEFGIPSAIKATHGGLYLVDRELYQIHKIDRAGDLQLSFGGRGQGPGEFQSIAGFWPLTDRYLVYDYNSFKFVTFDLNGEMTDEEILEENPVNPGSGRSIPITVEALPSGKLLIPTGGSEGSLFAIAEPGGGEVIYAGTALGEFVQEYNNQEVMQAYSSGEIPDIMLNLVMLSNSSNAIYSLQQTTGVLEKFTHSGERVWELELNIPGQEGLMDRIAQHNIEAGRSNGRRERFLHARAMDANEEGVAILLNLPDDQPLTIAWVPADGNKIDLIEIEGISLDFSGSMVGFTVSPYGRHAYYLEPNIGTIYKIEWPL